MTIFRKSAAAFVVAGSLLALVSASGDGPALVNPQREEIPRPAMRSESARTMPRFRFVGSASCAASNCHGGDGSRTVQRGSDPLSPQAYSLWAQRDPHARAYRVLYQKESQQIAERLNLKNAYTAKVCLDCHAINASKAELTQAARFTLHDGVGCEACHGAAERWLDSHKWPAWSQISPQERRAQGYRDLRDLGERARLCAECHVGSFGKEVNHDLIAAGHPRMAFELSAYHSNLPKHWNREAVAGDQIDAKLWLLGQSIGAEASAGLLAQRAADKNAPWPEFSEYDCFACHHDLADPSWRQAEAGSATPRRPGFARWGTWHFQLTSLVEQSSGGNGQALDSLRQEMERSVPRREEVRKLAEDARRGLAASTAAIARRPISPAERLNWISRLTEESQLERLENWDAAAQRYLACSAMNYSSSAAAGAESPAMPSVDAALRTIRELLEFPSESETRSFNSPKNETEVVRRAVREAFALIHQAVASARN
jgi:hypothetical protein